MKLIIEYPEQVECNVCEKMIAPKEGTWQPVYLRKGNGEVVYPRCEDCQDEPDS